MRPFNLGWQSTEAPTNRALRLVEDVRGLDDERAALEYARVLRDFEERHWQIDRIFDTRFDEIAAALQIDPTQYSETKQRLIGSFFCHEYTYAAAAIMNPSIVPHPDQSGMGPGECRFVMSVRTVGEGHISTIAFREGILEANGEFRLWPQAPFCTAATLTGHPLHAGPGAVMVNRDPDSSLSNTVIFPITEQQRNGLEDLRLVQLTHEDGRVEWVGTYTAYSGHSIRSEILRTQDFRSFDLVPIVGRSGRNKGMALFPETIDGRYTMVSRHDGKNLFLLRSDRLDQWDDDGIPLMEPKFPWEFIQIGNCGSPIRLDEGWLLLTHGVGAMRKYALGCALLDLRDPSKVLARSREPLLTAEDADRSGYVPNVVYTCGALRSGENILIPYGISDSAIGFATITTKEIVDYLE